MNTHLSVISTGNEGLDQILGGGLVSNRLYLLQGFPGSGKTTLALQFLLEGVRRKERVLYVALSETKVEMQGVAQSHGWSLDNIDIFELSVWTESLRPEAQYTMYHPSEVELSETTKAILAQVEAINPTRVVFDSLSEMRMLAQSPVIYRRQILGLKHFFVGRQCTVFLLDDECGSPEVQLESVAHGVINLEQLAPEYGSERRRLRVVKIRGVPFKGGNHDFTIRKGGLKVFPRMVAAEHPGHAEPTLVSSGLKEIDELLAGGLHRGTTTLLMGPAGSGKSSLSLQYMIAAAKRGEKSVVFTFDEAYNTMLVRARGMSMDVEPYIKAGLITVKQVDPAEMSPGEFGSLVQEAVDKHGAKILVIDSLNGYLNAMPNERFLIIQLHELFTYLSQRGVLTFFIVAQHGILGSNMATPVDASYMADTVIVTRYFELEGQVRQAISVVKKRSGSHERTIREMKLTETGIKVGEPLLEYKGIFTGIAARSGNGNDHKL